MRVLVAITVAAILVVGCGVLIVRPQFVTIWYVRWTPPPSVYPDWSLERYYTNKGECLEMAQQTIRHRATNVYCASKHAFIWAANATIRP